MKRRKAALKPKPVPTDEQLLPSEACCDTRQERRRTQAPHRGDRPSEPTSATVERGPSAFTNATADAVDRVGWRKPNPDDARRRVVSRQLNTQEGRHRLGRKVFFGRRGELRQAYRTGQEDQLGTLGLVLNAIVLWNTTYIDSALTELRRQRHQVNDADVARLTPLIDEHLNVHGRYTFTNPNPDDTLRPLRDPTTPDDE